jgi:hypothetical protein
MSAIKDYEGDRIDDTIIIKDGKVYSFNGFIKKDTDYSFRQAYLSYGFQHINKDGKQVYDNYSMRKMRTYILNPDHLRKGKLH